MEDEEAFLRKVFSEIFYGCSPCEFKGSTLYVKHFSIHDQRRIDDSYASFLREAVGEGLPKEKEREKVLIEEGFWSEEKNQRIKDLEAGLDHLADSRRKSSKESWPKIDEESLKIKRELVALRSEKFSLIGETANSYADNRSNDRYVLNGFFKDEEMSKLAFSDEDVDDMQDSGLSALKRIFSIVMSSFSDESIKKLALQDFFQSYWLAAGKNAKDFYGRPVGNLSFFQVKLANFGTMFSNLLENLEGIPEDARKDPTKLMDYATSVQRAKTTVERAQRGGGSPSSIVGMSKQDMEAAGVKSESNDILSRKLKEAKEKGKKRLGMKDVMEMFQ